MTVVWNSKLQRINSVNKDLQSSKINISAIVPLYTSLIDFIQGVREYFTIYEEEASMLDIVSEYSVKRKVKAPKSKNVDDTNSQGVDLTSRENFIFNTHYIICDKFIFELKKRNNAYLEIEKKFSFLFKSNKKKSDIIEYTTNLLDFFPNDLDK